MNKKIKVLQIVWRFNTGGAERMVVNFHNNFSNNKDIQIRTLSFTPSKDEIWEKELCGGDVKYLPNAWYEYLPHYLKLLLRNLFYKKYRKDWFLSQVKEYSPDVIHIHLANMASELYGVCKTLSKSIRVYYHMHSMPEVVPIEYKDNIIKAFSDNTYIPLCVTEQQLRSAKKIYGISNAAIVYNGIDESKFLETNLTNAEIEKLKSSFRFSNDDFVIGTIGRGAPVKNFPLLAKIAAVMAQKRRTVLVIVGEVSQDLRNTILANCGCANVVFTGQRNDTNRIYKLFDVFVLTSFFESSSIVTVEAQLSGIPCVISDSISDEIIISNAVSKISPYEKPEIWAEAIEEIVHLELRLQGEKRFDIRESITKLSRIYKNAEDYDKK